MKIDFFDEKNSYLLRWFLSQNYKKAFELVLFQTMPNIVGLQIANKVLIYQYIAGPTRTRPVSSAHVLLYIETVHCLFIPLRKMM